MAHVRRGDQVVVTKGKDKGKRGAVLRVIGDRVIVEKVNVIKRHSKPSQKNPQGGIVEKEGTIHVSNVLLWDEKLGRGTRTRVVVEDGVKIRVAFARQHTGVGIQPRRRHQRQDLAAQVPHPPRIDPRRQVVLVHQRLQLAQRPVALRPRQWRRQVVDDHRLRPPLGLRALAGVVDDERIDMRHRPQRHLGEVGLRQRHRLARQPLEVAVLAQVDDRVSAEAVAHPAIEGDVEGRRLQVGAVVDGRRILIVTAGRLDADEDVAETEPGYGQAARVEVRGLADIAPAAVKAVHGGSGAGGEPRAILLCAHPAGTARVRGGAGELAVLHRSGDEALDEHLARVGAEQPGGHRQRRGLAGPVRADQPEEAAGRHGQVDPADGVDPAERLVQAAHVDGEMARATARSSRLGAAADSLIDMATNLAFLLGVAIHVFRIGDMAAVHAGMAALLTIPVGLALIGATALARGEPLGFDLVKHRISAPGAGTTGWRQRLGRLGVILTSRDCYALIFSLLAVAGLASAILFLVALAALIWAVVVLVVLAGLWFGDTSIEATR